jgi:hypothetical protein
MPDLTVCSAGEAAILGLHPVPGWRPRAPDATHGREDKNARKYRCFVRDCAEFDPGAIGAGNDPSRLFIGYAIGGGLMIAGGIVELLLGVAAERKELEQIARPLTAITATQVPRAPMPRAHYSPRRPSA